jgi:tRNA(Arg) A34 adenosine deaminase TadA
LTVDFDRLIVDFDRPVFLAPLPDEVDPMHDDHEDQSPPQAPGTAAFLERAIELAFENAAAGQLPFGALVVRDGEVLATGVNTSLRDHDPTAHAEVEAIRNACRDLHTLALPGATLVSNCEPCALCHAAAASAGILRVVYAAPKEVAFAALGAPAGPPGALLTEMQRALRSLVPEQIEHVPTEGAGRPFDRFTTSVRRP